MNFRRDNFVRTLLNSMINIDDSKIDMKFNCDHTMQPIPWDSKTMGSRYDYLIALKCLKCSIIRTEVERIV